jgi:hypothetical protein
MLKRRAAKAGIAGRIHLHGVRHSHAVALDTGGVPVTEIQRQLPLPAESQGSWNRGSQPQDQDEGPSCPDRSSSSPPTGSGQA